MIFRRLLISVPASVQVQFLDTYHHRDIKHPDDGRDNTVGDVVPPLGVSREQEPETAIDHTERNQRATKPNVYVG